MKRPVIWSRSALDDLKAQVAYIAAENPAAAQRVSDAIRAAASALSDIPTGRPGRVTDAYEKLVTRLPYIIAYTISSSPAGEVIAIVRVIHTARDWPEEQWPKA
ncbi:type II toxin-antitoxin system RelE/ParE family toxin [Tabrizicola sp.]|uniref:type II toxin-antitoxin system RelE/ParE family toxin n=1 Tax=Tabrizicola sp. TaxID=2005166 RepID=UPI002733EFE8|nr:type II toxin-antitoxin system RelE/ParE family toxin [Tabrizicola sp.]MDP3198033.1 type II toxin-antitoxin system RelE/ParE family toxin [Tabrizicola sp.]